MSECSDPTYYALKAIEALSRVLDGRQPDTGVCLDGYDTGRNPGACEEDEEEEWQSSKS